jgi:hypothetical protein
MMRINPIYQIKKTEQISVDRQKKDYLKEIIDFYESKTEEPLQCGDTNAQILAQKYLSIFQAEIILPYYEPDIEEMCNYLINPKCEILEPELIELGEVFCAGFDEKTVKMILKILFSEDSHIEPSVTVRTLCLLQGLQNLSDHTSLLVKYLNSNIPNQIEAAENYIQNSISSIVARWFKCKANSPIRLILEQRYQTIIHETITIIKDQWIEANISAVLQNFNSFQNTNVVLFSKICELSTDRQWNEVIKPILNNYKNHCFILGGVPTDEKNFPRMIQYMDDLLQLGEQIPFSALAKFTFLLHNLTEGEKQEKIELQWQKICEKMKEAKGIYALFDLEDMCKGRKIIHWQIFSFITILSMDEINALFIDMIEESPERPFCENFRAHLFLAAIESGFDPITLLDLAYPISAEAEYQMVNRLLCLLMILMEHQTQIDQEKFNQLFQISTLKLSVDRFSSIIRNNPFMPHDATNYQMRKKINTKLFLNGTDEQKYHLKALLGDANFLRMFA